MSSRRGRDGAARRLILTGGAVVTPDVVIEGGSVVVEDGRIAAIESHRYPLCDTGREIVIDVSGRHVLPGLVCLHNDAIEKAVNPRPGANFPPGLALMALDRSLASVGVTTQFHALAFIGMEGNERSVAVAAAVAEAIEAFRASMRGLIDHHVLFRCDVRSAHSLDTVCRYLHSARVKLVAFTDPALGQGLPRDVQRTYDQLRADVRAETTLEQWQARWTTYIADTESQIPRTHETLSRLVREIGAILMAHDDADAQTVEAMHALGCRIAEFPLTEAAARRAHELGMPVSVGAANLVRGRSLSGNAGARALARAGLVDILLADYHAPSLLRAVRILVYEEMATFPQAVAMVTANPARAVGLEDRGMLEPGLRADLAVVDLRRQVPEVTRLVVEGDVRYEAHAAGDAGSSDIMGREMLPAIG